jgi:hypothetical protein
MRPFNILVMVVLAASVAIRLTGPWHFSIAGHEIRGSSAGGMLWGLYVIVLLRLAIRPRRGLVRLKAWWAGLDARLRMLYLWVGAPIGLWLLPPSHAKGFLAFLENRTSGVSFLSMDNLVFYPRSVVEHYSRDPVVGALALMLAIVAVVIIFNRGGPNRPLALATLVGLASVFAHPYKDPRFLFTVAPQLWLSAGLMVAQGIAVVSGMLPGLHRTNTARVLAVVALSAVWLRFPVDRHLVAEGHRVRTVAPSVVPLLDDVAETSAGSKGGVLLGHWNQLSPGLVEWHSYRRFPEIRRHQIPRWWSGRKRQGDVVSRLAGDESAELLFVVDADPSSHPDIMGFAAENRWLIPVRAALADDPRFEPADHRTFPESGYHLEVYRRR